MLKIKNIIKKKRDKTQVQNTKPLKLLPFQIRLNQVKNLERLTYYDETFIVVNTFDDSYIIFDLIAPAMRPMNTSDVNYTVDSLASSYVTLEREIRYMINNDYISLSAQKKFWRKKLEQATDAGRIDYIQEKLFQFEADEKHGEREVYYAKIFGKDAKEAIKHAYNFMKNFPVYISIPLNENETKRLLRFEHNPNERIKRDEEIN